MTYSHVVMWLWVITLAATLIGLALAWRGSGRASQAADRLRAGAGVHEQLAGAVEQAAMATTVAANARIALQHRSRTGVDPGPNPFSAES